MKAVYTPDDKHSTFYFYCCLSIITAFLLIQWFILPETYTFDTADGVWHYIIARYSYWNPTFELDLWAKPVFTILAAPFAQYGLKGIHLMQIIATTVISLFSFKIASRFNLKHVWLLPVLITFTPVFFPEIYSGLTEIIFSLILIIGIYLVVIEKWEYAVIVFSFLPFVRQEGYFMFPIITLVLLYQKKYLCIPLLMTGYVLITIYGYSTFHSFLWIIDKNPYKGAADLYGSGDFFFYINALDELLGAPRKILFYGSALIILLTIIWNIRTFRTWNKKEVDLYQLFFILFGYTFTFILAESTFWAFGLFGALGMNRLIVCVVPLLALIILIGVDKVFAFAEKFKLLKVYYVALTILTVFLINSIFKQYYWPFSLKGENAPISEACLWYNQTKQTDHKIYYSHPYTIICLNLNPYDKTTNDELHAISDKQHPENNTKTGDMIIWDGHYSPNECRLPLDALLNNPNFKVINKTVPKEPFEIFKVPFEVYIFERL